MRPVSPESEARRALEARPLDAARDRYRRFLVGEIGDYMTAGPGYAGALAATRAQLVAFDALRSTAPLRSSTPTRSI